MNGWKKFTEFSTKGQLTMAETRTVVIDENAVQRVEAYIDKERKEKGVRLSIGSVFAMAFDKMVTGADGERN